MRSHGALWGSMRPYGALWGLVGPYEAPVGVSWASLGLQWDLVGFLSPGEASWPMAPEWGLMGPHGPGLRFKNLCEEYMVLNILNEV